MTTDIGKPDIVGAHRRAESIRQGMRSFIETRALIAEAFEQSDWIILGYTSWETYCEKEFGVKQLRLSKEERAEAASAFRDVGMTLREIGAATGTSSATAKRDLDGLVSDETKEAQVSDNQTAVEPASLSAVPPAPLQGISQDRALNLAETVGKAYGFPTTTGITEDDADAVSDDVQEQPPVPGSGVSRDARPADPEEVTSPLSGEADPEQGGTGVTRPAPDPSDPAALIQYFADLWGYVDFEAAGPLLTSADMQMLDQSLISIANGVEALVKWRERAQP
jgi:hypothetical protein